MAGREIAQVKHYVTCMMGRVSRPSDTTRTDENMWVSQINADTSITADRFVLSDCS
jgi:hypothetical protein